MRSNIRWRRAGHTPRLKLNHCPHRRAFPWRARTCRQQASSRCSGEAMLGIAGAYLLRAMAETGSVPRLAVAWTGIIYAFLWLVWAARTRAESRLAPAVYACTSALILAPMLWELTLSFKLLPAPVAAVVLGAYGLGSVALAGKRGHPSVLRVSLLASAALSLAMAIASHEFLPFICLLLLLAALGEFAPLPDRLPETEALIALAADAAIWTMIFIYFSPPNAHADYPQLGKVILLAPGILIFLIATIGVILQTMVYRRRIGIFATIQATIAFLLAAVSLADFGPPRVSSFSESFASFSRRWVTLLSSRFCPTRARPPFSPHGVRLCC